jgi:MFS family permease
MKIDLVGPERRGLAMGLNEFAGYVAVAFSALATGYIAETSGLRPEPFYLGIGFAAVGLALSQLLVRETHGHAVLEERSLEDAGAELSSAPRRSLREVFAMVGWRDRALSCVSHTGLVNNLNDGLAWGLLPLFFAGAGLGVAEIGVLAFIYTAAWGLLQLWTGALSDRWGRKWLIAGGMVLQGLALVAMPTWQGFPAWVVASGALGLGTAMVYPTLLAAIGDVAKPRWRGSAVGMYRLWRDSGYVVGALLAGITADLGGMVSAIWVVAALTLLSGLNVAWRMPETLGSFAPLRDQPARTP